MWQAVGRDQRDVVCDPQETYRMVGNTDLNTSSININVRNAMNSKQMLLGSKGKQPTRHTDIDSYIDSYIDIDTDMSSIYLIDIYQWYLSIPIDVDRDI